MHAPIKWVAVAAVLVVTGCGVAAETHPQIAEGGTSMHVSPSRAVVSARSRSPEHSSPGDPCLDAGRRAAEHVGHLDELVASFTVPAHQAANWFTHITPSRGVSGGAMDPHVNPFAALPADASVSLCWVKGRFVLPLPSPKPSPTFKWGVISVIHGNAGWLLWGTRDAWTRKGL